jgi:hypothetical protein
MRARNGDPGFSRHPRRIRGALDNCDPDCDRDLFRDVAEVPSVAQRQIISYSLAEPKTAIRRVGQPKKAVLAIAHQIDATVAIEGAYGAVTVAELNQARGIYPIVGDPNESAPVTLTATSPEARHSAVVRRRKGARPHERDRTINGDWARTWMAHRH